MMHSSELNLKISNRWIVSKVIDLPIFVFLPVLILAGYAIISQWISFEVLFVLVSISAGGHHVPGFIRAYTDPFFLSQYRYRLTVIPLCLLVTAIVLSYYNLGVLSFFVVAWSLWHGCLQNYGFLRIYDFKSGVVSNKWAKLDFWTYITCYLSILFFFGMRQTSLIVSFYEYGGWIIPTKLYWFLKWLLWLSAGITLCIFTISNIYKWLKGEIVSIRKLVFFCSSLIFWYYCMKLTSHIVLGLILVEIFHDVQYNVFVWYYNRKRVKEQLSQSKIERFLFKKSWLSLFIYATVIFFYGCIGLINPPDEMKFLEMPFEFHKHWLFKVFIISSLLHFYVDGFIWKVRNQKVQMDLGVKVLKPVKQKVIHNNFFHNFAWGCFFVIVILMSYSEYQYRESTLQYQNKVKIDRSISLSNLIPKSWLGNFLTASFYEKHGNLQKAITYYQRAVESYPEEILNYIYLGNAYTLAKEYNNATRVYQQAKDIAPNDQILQEEFSYSLIREEKYSLAIKEFQMLIKNDSLNPNFWRDAGQIWYVLNDLEKAKYFLKKALSLKERMPEVKKLLAEIALYEEEIEKSKQYQRK